MSIFYRAKVIGSMLRPEYLKAARKQLEAGKFSAREFNAGGQTAFGRRDRASGLALALFAR